MSIQSELYQASYPAKPLSYEHDLPEYVQARDSGKVVEVDEEMYWYFLEVLPPTGNDSNPDKMVMNGMGGQWYKPDGTFQRFEFAFAEGAELLTIFWRQMGRYYSQKTDVMNGRW